MNKEIPLKIKALFDRNYTIDYIGKYNDVDAYNCYIKNAHTGFPVVCLLRADSVEQITGFDALDIINELIKE